MHFFGKNGEKFDVEIWGDKPNGHNEEKYAKTRIAKEEFNISNKNFIGIHHSDCYEDEKLSKILFESIGRIEPFKFDKPTDHLIYSTHWSNADELLKFCRELASQMPDGEFPAEDWLRKRGKWADREGDVYNTLSVYIKQWLGGIRNLRSLIDQESVSTRQWDKESALNSYKIFYEKHGLTPQQVRHLFRRKSDSRFSESDSFEAQNIASAVNKYFGSAKSINEILGISVDRQGKWTKDLIIKSVIELFNEFNLSPNQIIYKAKKGSIDIPASRLIFIKQLKDAISRFPGGLAGVYEAAGLNRAKID